MIGLVTLTISISSKCMSEARNDTAEFGHVLILTLFIVLINLHFFTLTPTTYLPKLPMLMSCPTSLIVICLLLYPTYIQSSLVAITVLIMLISS